MHSEIKRDLYCIEGYAVEIILIMIPIQIAIFIKWLHPITITGRFELFQKNWLLGLISFDFLSMINNLLMFFCLLVITDLSHLSNNASGS